MTAIFYLFCVFCGQYKYLIEKAIINLWAFSFLFLRKRWWISGKADMASIVYDNLQRRGARYAEPVVEAGGFVFSGMQYRFCQICFVAQPTILFLHCQHISCCSVCGDAMIRYYLIDGNLPPGLDIDPQDPFVACPWCMHFHRAATECKQQILF